MCGITFLALLLTLSAQPCPPGCPCGCGDGHGCVCATYATGATAPDAIQTAKETAEKEGRNVVVEVAGMSSAGLPGTEHALRCAVGAVEQSVGPAVYVGVCRGNGAYEWVRYRPRPAISYYVPPPLMFFAPMFGSGGGC